MKIEVTHPRTGQTVQVDLDKATPEQLAELLAPRSSLTQIRQRIDNLSYPRNVKAILGELAALTLDLGSVVLHIGHKLLELVFAVAQRYPHTTFYTLMGCVLGYLISAIPVLGWLVGWLVLPLFTALGLALGVWNDFQTQQQVRQLQEQIRTLRLRPGVDYFVKGGDQ